jgi:8-oxo-dGTP pyrophosphatase MutT (NUDIX family)
MLKIHLTGRWTRGQVLLRESESTYHETAESLASIESEWQKVKARLGDKIFDGAMCRMERWQVTPAGVLEIELSQTSYRIFVGTNMAHPEWIETIGRHVMANTVGVSTTLITADNHIMLGRRSDNVAYYPRRLHPFSGSLEPRDKLDLFDEALRELHEELGLVANEIAEIACIGIIEDMQLRHPETVLYARTEKTRLEIEQSLRGNEHTDAWSCPATRTAVQKASTDRSEFTPVAQGSLELLSRHLPG